MLCQIDKGIPIPHPRQCGRMPYYPMDTMDVGDSFLVPDSNVKGRATALVSSANKRHAPKRFTSRKVTGGHRVWRIE